MRPLVLCDGNERAPEHYTAYLEQLNDWVSELNNQN